MTSPALPAPGSPDGPPAFTVTYVVSAAEQVRGTRAVVRRRPARWFTYAALLLLPLMDAGMKWRMHGQWKADRFTPVLAGSMVLAVAAIYLEPWFRVRRLRSRFPQMDGPSTLLLDESGVSITSALGSGRVVWALVEKVRASREFLFIHLGGTNAYLVPTRALSAEQLDAFWWVLGRWAPHLVPHSRAS